MHEYHYRPGMANYSSLLKYRVGSIEIWLHVLLSYYRAAPGHQLITRPSGTSSYYVASGPLALIDAPLAESFAPAWTANGMWRGPFRSPAKFEQQAELGQTSCSPT